MYFKSQHKPAQQKPALSGDPGHRTSPWVYWSTPQLPRCAQVSSQTGPLLHTHGNQHLKPTVTLFHGAQFVLQPVLTKTSLLHIHLILHMHIIQWDKGWKELNGIKLLLHFWVHNSSCKLTGMTEVYRKCYSLFIFTCTAWNTFSIIYFSFSTIYFEGKNFV